MHWKARLPIMLQCMRPAGQVLPEKLAFVLPQIAYSDAQVFIEFEGCEVLYAVTACRGWCEGSSLLDYLVLSMSIDCPLTLPCVYREPDQWIPAGVPRILLSESDFHNPERRDDGEGFLS